MIYFVVPRDQEFGLWNYVERWGHGLIGLLSVVHYEDLPEWTSVPAGTYIFSALDQLSAGGTRMVSELVAQLRGSPSGGRVLNDPKRALLRFELLEELYHQGLNRHRAARATEDFGTLQFPVFLREEFRHSGSLSSLLRSRRELEGALGRAALKGYRLRELLVVEFCDTSDKDGVFRKYSAFGVGSEVIARGMALGHRWMLKQERSEFSEAMLLEERAYVLANPHEAQLRRIFAVAGIEYGRIDYAMKDGAVETWEINLNPTIGPGRDGRMTTPEEFMAIRQVAGSHFYLRFHAALQAMDVASTASIPVAYSEECRREALPMLRAHPALRKFGPLVRALSPIRPLLDGAVRLLSPWVIRAARRRR